MFEGLIASVLNKWLGKYVEDLDTEHLNIGIFSGEVKLNNLKLKPEALYELELPIEVKHGVIGIINMSIPWSSLSSQAIVINVEDVLILCNPVGSETFSPEREKRLLRALKKKILEDLEVENLLRFGPGSLFDGLLTALTNNIQIFFRKIHVRFEDKYCNKGIVCGLCIESLSMETTNSKWKPCSQPAGNSTVHQLAKLEAASIYFNAKTDETDFLNDDWRQDLKEGLQTFSIRGKAFDFVIKPFNSKVKVIVSRSKEARVPKLLVDLVIHDIVLNLTRAQLHSVVALFHSFRQIHLKRPFLSFRPNFGIHKNAREWWKYTCEAVLQQRVRPYQWKSVQRHRHFYRAYKELYRSVVLNPGDIELRLDLALAEDNLSLSSIVIAREQAKIEIKNEDPDKIEVVTNEDRWWTFYHSNVIRFQVRSEKPKGIWARLSPNQKQKIEDFKKSDVNISPEKAKKYIEHKVNFTIHNISGSIFIRGIEIATLSITQFLTSFETRPAAHAFKLSVRADSMTFEGAASDEGLVPIINVASGAVNTSTNFICIDFEKNPLGGNADFGISINLAQLGIIYYEHAFSQFLNFFQGVGVTPNFLKTNLLFYWSRLKQLANLITSRQVKIDVNTCVKAPYVIISENGSMQRAKSVMVLDFGKWTVHTDLQLPFLLEDVTQMELEEKLYDRLHINMEDFQVLFCNSGDDWRQLLDINESENHIISKTRGQIVLSNSTKPDYKLLSKCKLNVLLHSIKMSLSDRKIVMLLDFLEGVPLPSSNVVSVSPVVQETDYAEDIIKADVTMDLNYIKNLVVFNELSRQRTPDNSESLAPNLSSVAAEWSSVEVSDDDVELWARTVDLPGFDDNISPSNIITSLLRFIVRELIFVLSRSSDTIDKPYLMVRIAKIQLDSAFMNYGPAIQVTLGGLQLIDQLHLGPSGEYLEIISTLSDADFISLLYRKVRSDCPDFKTHFYSVEQSLIVDVGVLALTLHKEAILTFTKYLQYLYQKIAHREIFPILSNVKHVSTILDKLETQDPPIPPGAVKFSYSFHLAEFRLRLCDTDLEFLEFKVRGLESDCMFKANERMILRGYLAYISLDDLSDISLYPKIVSIEEDRVLEFKYVRHSPRLYNKGLGTEQDDVRADGSLKFNLERIHVVVIYKTIVDLQHFIEPIIPLAIIWSMTGFIRKSLLAHINQFKGWNTRLHLSLKLHLPILLIPQKSISPNLLVLDLGELNVENFFKELSGYTSKDETTNVIDNILLKLDSASLSRALMTLAGRMEVQENILDPIHAKLDIKRFVGGPKIMFKVDNAIKSKEIPLFEIYGNLEPVKISFGQKDLLTFLSVWTENFEDRKFLENSWWLKSVSPIDGRTPTENEDLFVRKLQVFLNHSDACRKDIIATFVLDHISVDLYNDIGEVISSPIRDLNHGLCRLTLTEASIFLEKYYDSSMEIKLALQNCLLEDIRTCSTVVVKKVFQSNQGGTKKYNFAISISTPPIVDVTFKQTPTGDRCVDILVEKTRLNLSSSFVAAFSKFAIDSIPIKKNEGGFINHGYVGDLGNQKCLTKEFKTIQPPLSTDSTSGYYSSAMSCATDEQSGLSVSLQCRKPEFVIFSSEQKKLSAILFRSELLVDWSKYPGRDELVITLAGLQAWSKSYSDSVHAFQKSTVLLNQCDIEVSRNVKSFDDDIKIDIRVSPIDIRLGLSTLVIITEIIQELRTTIFTDDRSNPNHPLSAVNDYEDLWSPKKLSSYCEANICAAVTEPLLSQQPSFPVGRPAESLIINIPQIKLLLYTTLGPNKKSLLLAESSFKLAAHDWSSSINLKGELQVQAAYYNEKIDVWEPFIEPCNGIDGTKPWKLAFHAFQGKSFPISPHVNFQKEQPGNKERKISNPTDEPVDSQTSGEESDQEMVFLRRRNFDRFLEIKRQNFSLSCGDSSDSESEDGAFEKLTNAVDYLFTKTGEYSDKEISDSADSSATEADNVEEQEVETEEETNSTQSTNQERAVFLKKHYDSVDSGLETEAVERLAVHVILHSENRLELTFSLQSVKILQEISIAFSESPTIPTPTAQNDQITVKNFLGPGSVVTLLSKSGSFPETAVFVANFDRDDSPPSSPGSIRTDQSPESEHEPDFDNIEKDNQSENIDCVFQYSKKSVAQLYNRVTENRLLIQVPGFTDLRVIAPKISCSKLHLLQPNRNQTRYYITLTTKFQFGLKNYVVSSPLKILNSTSYAMEVYYNKKIIESLGEKVIGETTNPFGDLIRLAVIEPDDFLNIPLFIAYHCKIHVAPAHISNYHVSELGISWHEIVGDVGTTKDLCCLSKQENNSNIFSIKAYCGENIKLANCSRPLPECTIRLLPPLTVLNYLPYAIEVKLLIFKYETRIEAGDQANIYFVDLQKPQKIIIEIPEYLGIHWAGTFNLTTDVEEKVINMITEQDTEGGNKQLSLSLLVTRNPSVKIQIYSSYWLINKTGLPLQIRGSLTECIHEWVGEGPLLFGFRKQRRRCVRIRAFTSSWSSAFSLDALGCSGLAICKDKERRRRYRILVQSHLSQTCPKLTKIISFLPNFIITNSCKKHLRFMEDNERADLWIDIAPGQCLPFWPETDSMRMFVKFRDSKHISQHFPLTISHTTVLRMDKGCGITVKVEGGVDQPFLICFQNYMQGDAPVRIDNQCEDLFLKFHQKDSGQVVLLSPYQSLLYTWDDPCKERSLLWNVYNNKGKDFCVPFWKDGFGEEKVSFHVVRRNDKITRKLPIGLKRLNQKSLQQEDNSSSSDDSEEDSRKPKLAKKIRRDKIIVYWASYLRDRQRVLLLTQDERQAKRIRRTLDAERSHLELFVSIAGIGISLINKNKEEISRELAYFSLSDSAAQWEVTVANRWKIVALELASWLEDKYKQGLPKAQIKDYIHIDFEKMQMTKPFFAELRRKHRPAIWIQYRRSRHMSLFHFQLHRLQIDNQLHDAEFPTVLYPVPPPSTSLKFNSKPAFEIAYLRKYSESCSDIYKFVKFIVQEHRLQLEKSWVSEISNFWGSWQVESSSFEKIRRDIALVHMPIHVKAVSDNGNEKMFEYLHCSPIKLHITFSSSQVEQDYKDRYFNPLVDYLLFTLAPHFAQVKSITVKLFCFEAIGQLCSKDFVWNQGIQHFKSQLWQQLYVLVMGINVLTNPYSQFLDLSDDSHPLFYEPYLENTGVPEEFSDGISAGALGLLGHETGGSSGTDTLFAALLGTALQTVIQPEDSKKSSQLCEKYKDLPESIIQSFSNFLAVCSLALSGVVMKQNTGNGSLQGVENFFKGPGKGLMGLMTKSHGGVFNCLEMIADGVKRAMEMGENVISRTRLPRYVNPILGLRPCCGHEARGLNLLKIISKGLYANDIYWAHAALCPEYKTILLITLQHIFLIIKYKSWGPYEIMWTLRMDDLMAVPTIQDDKLIFNVRQEARATGVWSEEKTATSNDKELLKWLKNQIEGALVLSIEDKPCP